jgi:hypothetical protein
MFENQLYLVENYSLMSVIRDHFVFLMIQIDAEFLHALQIVIQFYVRDHEFFPNGIIKDS